MGNEAERKTDKKSLVKPDLILTEKMLIRQCFFVFFDFHDTSGDLYYENLRCGLHAPQAGLNISADILF